MSARRWRSVHFTTLRPASLSWMHHRQKGRCAYCERSTVMPPKGSDHREAGVLYASRDHRVPLARGGDDHRPNVVMACIPCNGRKGAMEWPEWQEFMRENPRWWEAPEAPEQGA